MRVRARARRSALRGLQCVGLPLCLRDNERYARNALLFAVALLLPARARDASTR